MTPNKPTQNAMIFGVYRRSVHQRTTVRGFRALASTILNEAITEVDGKKHRRPMIKRPITDKQLKEKLGGCSDMTIWRLRRDGKLPKPRKLGSGNVTLEEEADEAMQN